jgi:signal transduction histidine kinase
MNVVESALSRYLKQSSSSTSFHFSLQNKPPDTLDFIRLTKGKDQLLITGNNSMAFTGLVDLDPLTHGAWINLSHPEKQGEWLLISKKLADGSVAQAGKNDSSTGLAIYEETISTSYLIFLLTALPCLSLAFLFRYMIREPLRTLATDIKHALEQEKATLPRAPHQDNDLTRLYRLLEKTFSQNRQLIVEMQSSLDNVAHDLRTPMTRLRAVAEYALQSDKDDPQLYRSALSDCLEESERVLSMLKIMMSVAEAEAGTMQLNPQKTNLMETLEDVMGLYQYVAEEEQITVSCNTNDKEIFILADKTRISQVWANLLDNAIKYGHESGKITISAEVVDGQAAIRFCDDGMGISETEINRIWDRLYRGDRSRTKQGLGLGLNYVKAVVEAHEGQIVVTSKIREGTCFEVRLPITSSAATGKAEITN